METSRWIVLIGMFALFAAICLAVAEPPEITIRTNSPVIYLVDDAGNKVGSLGFEDSVTVTIKRKRVEQ